MQFVVLPLLGGFIGWFTNYLAIRMLFRPRQAWRLPYTPFAVQGLLPRRRRELIEAISTTVAGELLPADHLLQHIASPRLRRTVAKHVSAAVTVRVTSALPAFLPQPLVELIGRALAEGARREVDRFFETALPVLLADMQGELDVAAAVRERLEAVSLDDLEALILRLAGTELRHIEFLGGVIGVVIGLVEAVLSV